MPLKLFDGLMKTHVAECKWVEYVYRAIRGGAGTPYCDVCIQRNIQRRPENARRWIYRTRGPYFKQEKVENFWCRACGKNIATNTDHEISLKQRGLPAKIYVTCRCMPEEYLLELNKSKK